MSDEINIDDENAFFLHPGELALAMTYESVTLPNDIVGWLDGRSSLARLGLMGLGAASSGDGVSAAPSNTSLVDR